MAKQEAELEAEQRRLQEQARSDALKAKNAEAAGAVLKQVQTKRSWQELLAEKAERERLEVPCLHTRAPRAWALPAVQTSAPRAPALTHPPDPHTTHRTRL